MVVSPTTLLAAVGGLFLTTALSALGMLHLLTNPVEGSSEHPSYDTYSATNPYNLMLGWQFLARDLNSTHALPPRTTLTEETRHIPQ